MPQLEQYKALLQDIGLLAISHVLEFLFFHSLYDHTWPQVGNDESVTVLWYQNKLIKVIEWLLYYLAEACIFSKSIVL